MRIRTVFLACCCAVAVPGTVASTWLSVSAWRSWEQAGVAEAVTQALSDAQQAQTAVAVEIGGYGSELRIPQPNLAVARRNAEETRRLLPAVAGSAGRAGLDAGPTLALVAEVNRIRTRLQAELAKPLDARDLSAANASMALRNQAVETLRRLAQDAALRLTLTSPDAALLAEAASAVMDLRDFAGRRSVILSNWIGGAPVQPAAFEEALQFTGRIEQSWMAAQRLIAAFPNEAALQAAVAVQVRTLQEGAEPRWRQTLMLARGGTPAAWPQAVAEFRGWSVDAQAGILALRDAALEVARARTGAALARSRNGFLAAALLALVAGAVAAGAVTLLLRRVVRPLRALTGSVTRIAEGELEIAVPGHGRGDELGEMARAVETLRANSVERQAMQVAQQDGQRQQIARAEAVDRLLRDFEEDTAGVLRAVASAASEMDATAAGMVDIASSGNSRAAAVAGASQQASGNVQTVAAAAEELSASIAEVARQVRDGAARAQAASQAAEHTDRTVRGLSEAAGRIGDVVQLITGIASQTNLLALNATIEAARAGESGKGFAVVAGEVKSLASQTARATEEIGQQIAGMQAETARTVQAIGEIARMIRELNEATGLVAEAAGQQAEATREIGHAVAQAAAGTEEASRHAAGVSEDAERTGRAANDVRSAAGELAQQAEGLRGRMDGFLGALRVA